MLLLLKQQVNKTMLVSWSLNNLKQNSSLDKKNQTSCFVWKTPFKLSNHRSAYTRNQMKRNGGAATSCECELAQTTFLSARLWDNQQQTTSAAKAHGFAIKLCVLLITSLMDSFESGQISSATLTSNMSALIKKCRVEGWRKQSVWQIRTRWGNF